MSQDYNISAFKISALLLKYRVQSRKVSREGWGRKSSCRCRTNSWPAHITQLNTGLNYQKYRHKTYIPAHLLWPRIKLSLFTPRRHTLNLCYRRRRIAKYNLIIWLTTKKNCASSMEFESSLPPYLQETATGPYSKQNRWNLHNGQIENAKNGKYYSKWPIYSSNSIFTEIYNEKAHSCGVGV
jgi:hypothetical protein